MKEETCKIRRLEKLLEDQFNVIQILKQMCCQSDEMMKNDVGGRVDCDMYEKNSDDKNVLFEDFDKDLGGYNEFHDVDVVNELIKGDGFGFTELDVEANKVHTENSSREVVDKSSSPQTSIHLSNV